MENVIISLAESHPTLAVLAMVLMCLMPVIMPMVSKLQINASKKEITEEAKELDKMNADLIKKDTEIRKLVRNKEIAELKDDYTTKIRHLENELRGSWKTIEHEAMRKLHALEVLHSKEAEIAKETKDAFDKHLAAHEATNEKFFKILDDIAKTVQSMSNRMTEVETTIKLHRCRQGACE